MQKHIDFHHGLPLMTALECTEKLTAAKRIHREAIKSFMASIDKSKDFPQHLSDVELDVALSRRLVKNSRTGSSSYVSPKDKHYPDFDNLFYDDLAPYWDEVMEKMDADVRDEVKDCPREMPLSAVITLQDKYILIHSTDLAEIPDVSESAIASFESANEHWAVSWSSYSHGRHSADYSVPTFITVGMVDLNGENYTPGLPSDVSIFDALHYLEAISTENLSDTPESALWDPFNSSLMLRFPSSANAQIAELNLIQEKIQNASQMSELERDKKNAASASFDQRISAINQEMRELEEERSSLREQSSRAQHVVSLQCVGLDVEDVISHGYRNMTGKIMVDRDGPYIETDGQRVANLNGYSLMRELRAGEWSATTPTARDRQR